MATLTPLLGRVHASMFFHLFDEEKQRALALRLAGLLSPRPGSIIFGRHIAGAVKGARDAVPTEPDQPAARLFCHSPESWAALWDDVFAKGTERVETNEIYEVLSYANPRPEKKGNWMQWSTMRVWYSQ